MYKCISRDCYGDVVGELLEYTGFARSCLEMRIEMSKGTKGNTLGIGLILVVFIILCLITFATLSYMLSAKEKELSDSVASSVVLFYEADMSAQEQLQLIDEQLVVYYNQAQNEEEYKTLVAVYCEETEGLTFETVGNIGEITFQTDVSEKEKLISKLEIVYPATEYLYDIKSWTLESK